MQDKEKIRQKKMFENITVTHMFCLFAMLAAVLLTQDVGQENIYPVLNIRGILLIGFIGFAAVALYNLRLWGMTRANPGSKLDKLLDFMYISLSLVVAVITLVITGDSSVHVEVIFVLPVIITASIMGKKPGIIMATICMGFFISYDVYNGPEQSIYSMIENNLIVICVVYVVGWFTGSLADLEKEYRAELTLAANTDMVTGLYNHRYFQEKITEYLATDSKDFSLALIIIDVDYFKHYNDMQGHQVGDKLLNVIGSILKASVKNAGFCARYGGDEFVVVLPNFNSHEAVQLAEDIRNEISNYEFVGREYQPEGKVTLSCGIAAYPEQAANIKDLIKYADQALYRAKSLDKNKVELYYSVFDNLDIKEDEKELLNSIHTLVSVINAKDKYTFGHSERVTRYAMEIASQMGIPEKDIQVLGYAAFLHDIGKIEIARDILNKPGRLDEREWGILKSHPVWGSDIVKSVQQLKPAAEIILHHHENYDGSGYPDGLKGTQIPLLARIIRIADSFDAMITKRPYKQPLLINEALEELKKNTGIMFDPEITPLFIDMIMSKY